MQKRRDVNVLGEMYSPWPQNGCNVQDVSSLLPMLYELAWQGLHVKPLPVVASHSPLRK